MALPHENWNAPADEYLGNKLRYWSEGTLFIVTQYVNVYVIIPLRWQWKIKPVYTP